MKFIINPILILLAVIILSLNVKADEKKEPAVRTISPCLSDSRYQQFDFWLGQFDVYGDLKKKTPLAGKNTIVKQQNGCLIIESWKGSKGSTGMSMNYYDGTKDKWVQHWVSADGTTINIEGNIIDGSMVLVGKIYYANVKENKIRNFKGTWTPLENQVVRQFFEESMDSGKTWKPSTDS